jgi:hypothetical protein
MIDGLCRSYCITFFFSLLLVQSYLALSDAYVIEDDADDLDSKVVFVDDQLYRAWPHDHVRQSSILFVVVVEECRLAMDRLKK